MSLVKLMGGAAVVLSSAMTGIIMTKELGERTKLLREIHKYALYIKSDMEYRSPVFEECFRCRGRLFSAAAKNISEGMSPKDAVKKAAAEAYALREEDREILFSYADGLEAEEQGGQEANISLLISRLEESIKDAEREQGTKGRLYSSGGVIAGIGLVIILL
jgi:stage III sporulation protein AB